MPDPIKLGLDYSARRISGASIKAAGYDFVFRYLNFTGQRYPALNKEEYTDLTRSGVEVHAIFEISVHDPGGGAPAGRANAVTAVNSARAAGLPKGSTIFMCADAPVSQWTYSMAAAMAYLDGARVIIEDSGYVLGAYGFREFIYAAQDQRKADVFWLCGAESGVRDGIHAYQWNNGRVYVDGVECDLNKMYIEIGDDDLNAAQDAALSELWKTVVSGEKRDSQLNIDLGFVLTELSAKLDALSAKVDALATGGVSEERIGEIAVDAVRDDLND